MKRTPIVDRIYKENKVRDAFEYFKHFYPNYVKLVLRKKNTLNHKIENYKGIKTLVKN